MVSNGENIAILQIVKDSREAGMEIMQQRAETQAGEEEPAVKAVAVTRVPKGCTFCKGRCSDDQRRDYQNRLNNTFQSIGLHLTGLSVFDFTSII